MSKIYKGVSELIGKTPIIEAVNFEKAVEADATILAKLEYFNPAGSVKDRVALAMIEEAEKKGVLKKGATIPIALGEKSLKFPIGVPTTYNIPLIYHIRRHMTHKCPTFRV